MRLNAELSAEIRNGVLMISIPLKFETRCLLLDSVLEKALKLSPKEIAVLDLVCRGKSNKEIATAFNWSLSTAKRYLDSLLKKTGCHSRYGLIDRFAKKGGAERET